MKLLRWLRRRRKTGTEPTPNPVNPESLDVLDVVAMFVQAQDDLYRYDPAKFAQLYAESRRTEQPVRDLTPRDLRQENPSE